MYDPNDPGQLIDAESLQRIIRGIQRIEATLISTEEQGPYITRKNPDKFRIIRGRSVGVQSGSVVLMDVVSPLSGGRDPSAHDNTVQVRVANIYFPRTLADDQWFDAVFSPNVLPADDVRSGGVQVDWEVLETGSSSSTAPLRRFQLAQNKATTTSPALVYWLSDADALVGTDYVYDPEHYFSGAVAGSNPGRSFRGVALSRSDMGTGTNGDRWEIVDMEGYARWITGTWTGSGGIGAYTYSGIYPTTDNYLTREPYSLGATISIVATNIVSPLSGEAVLLMLQDADGAGFGQPRYAPVCVRDRTAFVRISGTANTDGGVSQIGSVFPGKYCNEIAGAAPASDATTPCWVTDLRGHTYLPNDQYYIGRLDGVWTNGTDSRPRFVISGHIRMIRGSTTADVRADASTFNINTITALHGPAPASSPVLIDQTFPVGYAAGQTVLAIEIENGHWINIPDSGKVRTSSADMMPDYLYDTLVNHGTYTGTGQSLVYAEQYLQDVTTLNYGIRLFTNTSGTGAGTGYTAGCGLTLTGTQFSFDYATVAGDNLDTGLDIKYNDPLCPNLRAIVNIEPGIIYEEADVAKEKRSAGGFVGLDPGDGKVSIYRQSTDVSVFLNFDPPVTIHNWSQDQKLEQNAPVIVATTREGDRFGIPLGNVVNRILFMYNGAIAAATTTNGPSITPTTITVEKLTYDDVLHKYKPSGETIDVEYFDGIELPTPETGKVYTGEALQVGGATPYVIVIYCKVWSVAGGA